MFAAALVVIYLGLHRVTGQRDLAVVSMFANRMRQTRGTVGFFANLLVLRTEIPRAGTFRDLLRAARTTVIEALAHQELPCQAAACPPRRGAQHGGRT